MDPCSCVMLVLLAVCFSKSGNAQKKVTAPLSPESGAAGAHQLETAPSPQDQSSSFELKTVCIRMHQCVFEMSKIDYSAIRESNLAIILSSDISCEAESISERKLCSCCNETAATLRNNLQQYLEACGVDVDVLSELRNTLLHGCEPSFLSRVYCSGQLDTAFCEFIKCGKQVQCEETSETTSTTTIITTPAPKTTTERLSSKVSSSTTSSFSTSSSITADDNRQSQSTFITSSSTLHTSDALVAAQASTNVKAVVLGIVFSILVAIGVAAFLIFLWRRRRARKSRKTHGSPSTIACVTEADTDKSQYSELSNSVGCRQTADKKSSGAQPNRDSEYEHEYSVIPADVVKFTHSNDLDPGYDVLIDVTKRKLPPAPAQDGEYSLARNPDGEMKKKPPAQSGLKPAVHSLAKTTAIQDLKGKNNTEVERKENQGQYFVLEKNEDDFDNAEKKVGQYFIQEENADGDKQPETGGQYFVLEKENADEQPEIGGQYFVLEKESADEKPETGGQYFVLEKESADEKPETGGQYFVLEKESAGEKPETGGQYFVLEKDTASGNDTRENGGQYFVMEKEDADENPDTGGQYFVLEKDSPDATGQYQTGDSKVYSSLNRDDMQPMDATEQASEYTALNNSRAGTPSPGAQKGAVPQHESVYSFQKPID